LIKRTIAIIGGGAAALMAAATLDENKYAVTIYEKNKTLGRKFLVAGDGGLNITHSETIDSFIQKYTPSLFLEKSLKEFTNNDLRAWLLTKGIDTFIGSSKRVYPTKSIKPINVLNAIIDYVKSKNVVINTGYEWTGFDTNNNLIFNNKEIIKADITIFALGGGSWKVTGSNDKWLNYFSAVGITTKLLQPSNCAFIINWQQQFIALYEGTPLKNINITCNGFTTKGEVVLTKKGIEGGAIYALSAAIRKAKSESDSAIISIDFKPMFSIETILEKLQNKGTLSISEFLKVVLKLPAAVIALLKTSLTKSEFNNNEILSNTIKKLPITIEDFGDIDEAISTVGGIDLQEVNENFELVKLPNHFAIGEMLDWDAPTGGYLLQACFSMGHAVARHLNLKGI
jgi:uncharacterized flavoprotein (TIGR03862 family)